MSYSCKMIHDSGTGEIVEKKSRFICSIYPVGSEAQANEYIEKIKKQYWDARHNCYAYVIGDNNEIARYSDDGEPQGTAGKPMLDILINEGIHYGLAIVTRYFGGTLLGTGGLIRAYQQSVKEGLKAASIIEKKCGREFAITTDYNGISKIQFMAASNDVKILDSEYTDVVVMKALVPEEMVETFTKKITEATAGRVNIDIGDNVFYGIVDKNIIIL